LALLGTEGGFVYLSIDFLSDVGQSLICSMFGIWGVASKVYLRQSKTLGSPEQRADVMATADIMDDQDDFHPIII
jgi:hypothetical protein